MTTTPTEPPALEPGVDAPELWQAEAELVNVGAPMLNAVREHLGKPVVIHIIGGMQVAGRLQELIEDDGVAMLLDGKATFYVALHAIAVLVTK